MYTNFQRYSRCGAIEPFIFHVNVSKINPRLRQSIIRNKYLNGRVIRRNVVRTRSDRLTTAAEQNGAKTNLHKHIIPESVQRINYFNTRRENDSVLLFKSDGKEIKDFFLFIYYFFIFSYAFNLVITRFTNLEMIVI